MSSPIIVAGATHDVALDRASSTERHVDIVLYRFSDFQGFSCFDSLLSVTRSHGVRWITKLVRLVPTLPSPVTVIKKAS